MNAPVRQLHATASHATFCNAMTIDVEDYFQVSAFADHIARDSWPTRECRVEANIERILAILEEGGAHGTFFTLGWIAERYPAMVKRIVAGVLGVCFLCVIHISEPTRTPSTWRMQSSG